MLTGPPPDIVSLLVDVAEAAFDRSGDMSAWIPKDAQAAIRESLELCRAGSAPLSRSILQPIVGAIESRYRTVVSDFRLTPQFSQLLRRFVEFRSRRWGSVKLSDDVFGFNVGAG